MKNTAHSEYGRLKKVLLKKVEDAFIDENHIAKFWQQLNYLDKPDFKKAVEEYHAFEELLKVEGMDISYLPKTENVTMDSLYCRDAAIATNGGMIICNMGKAGRIYEPKAEKSTFMNEGIKILGEIVSPGTVEGGDVAWLDEETLAVGHTYRTNEEGINQLRFLLDEIGVRLIVAEMPHYKGPSDVFHLMSVFSPIDKKLAVIYSPLMPIRFRNELLSRGYDFIEVPDEEFDSMGCNVLAFAPRKCMIVKGNPITKMRMEKAGCKVIEYEGKEISIKGGGGPTCLTRPVMREI